MRLKTVAVMVAAACAAGTGISAAQTQPIPAATFRLTEDIPPVAGARPIEVNTLDALKGDGIFYFSGSRSVNLRAADRPQADRYPVTETTSDIGVRAFHANVDVQNFVRDGMRRPIGAPGFVVPASGGGVRLIYGGASPLQVLVRMKGYDVAGLAIADFLRTSDNRGSPDAQKIGSALFPEGSVAFLADARFEDDVLMLPRRESFTGAANTKQMVANFSKENPYCLSYEDRDGATPYALRFQGAGTKGKVELFPAKPGTMFCARGADQPVADGVWEERMVGGTRAIVLSFGANVDPLDTGVSQNEREAALIAFIEATKGILGVRPGKLYKAGTRILDYEYRFNAAAATAIRSAFGVR
jgi:hypothetical protein